MREVKELSELRHETEDKRRFDCLVVESTGVSDPRSVAQAFATDEDLATRARLDVLRTKSMARWRPTWLLLAVLLLCAAAEEAAPQYDEDDSAPYEDEGDPYDGGSRGIKAYLESLKFPSDSPWLARG